jgi:hypothetical protein
MRRHSTRTGRLITGSLAITAALALTASAASADSITGSGASTVPYYGRIDVNATSGPAGENASGSFGYTAQNGAGDVFLQVGCLHVSTNPLNGEKTAFVGFTSFGRYFNVGGFWVTIKDGSAGDQFSQVYDGGSVLGCSSPVDGAGTLTPVMTGGFAIVDDGVVVPPTFPTSREDARLNYASYGFRNRGQAIAAWEDSIH